MNYSDNTKAIARKFGISIKEVMEVAREGGLLVSYSSKRKCWIIDTPAYEVRRLHEVLEDIAS